MAGRAIVVDGRADRFAPHIPTVQPGVEAVRTLPIRVAPVAGESLESWLEACASRNHVTWGEMLNAVGLQGESNRVRVPHYTVSPTAEQLSTISYATGVPDSVIRAMTTANLVDTSSSGSAVPDRLRLSRSRFCPKCLADSGGRWQLWWKFWWAFACPLHQCLLVDRCPRCSSHQRLRPLPKGLEPQPGHCTCRALGAPGRSLRRCGELLWTADTMDLNGDHPAIVAQIALLEVLAAGSTSMGIYSTSPASARQFFTDLTALGQRIMHYVSADELRTAAPQDLWNAHEHSMIDRVEPHPASALRFLVHDSSATLAMAVCVALPIVQATSPTGSRPKVGVKAPVGSQLRG